MSQPKELETERDSVANEDNKVAEEEEPQGQAQPEGSGDDATGDGCWNHPGRICHCTSRRPLKRKKAKRVALADRPKPGIETTYEPCVHLHFKTKTVSRGCLTQEEYADMLATPKGYPWQNQPTKRALRRRKRMARRRTRKLQRKKVGEVFATELMTDLWDMMTPELKDKMVDLMTKEFGMEQGEADKVVQRVPICNCGKKKKKKPRIGIRNSWVKEFSKACSDKITEYIVAMLTKKRSPRVKQISEVILSHLCDLTGEQTSLHSPKTKIQRLMVLISDRVALWLDDMFKERKKRRPFVPCTCDESEAVSEQEDEGEQEESEPEGEDREATPEKGPSREKTPDKKSPEKSPDKTPGKSPEKSPPPEETKGPETEPESEAEQEQEEEEKEKPKQEEQAKDQTEKPSEEKPEDQPEQRPEEQPEQKPEEQPEEQPEEKPEEKAEEKTEEQPEEKPEEVPKEPKEEKVEELPVGKEEEQEQPAKEEKVDAVESPEKAEEISEKSQVEEKEEKSPSVEIVEKKKSSPILIAEGKTIKCSPGATFAVQRGDGSHYKVSKVSSLTVAEKVAVARNREVPVRGWRAPKTVSPVNSETMKEWSLWAKDVASVAEEWNNWIETTVREVKRKAESVRPKAGEARRKLTSAEKLEWETWNRKKTKEAEVYRVEKRKIQDAGRVWDKKIQVKSASLSREKVTKVTDLTKTPPSPRNSTRSQPSRPSVTVK